MPVFLDGIRRKINNIYAILILVLVAFVTMSVIGITIALSHDKDGMKGKTLPIALGIGVFIFMALVAALCYHNLASSKMMCSILLKCCSKRNDDPLIDKSGVNEIEPQDQTRDIQILLPLRGDPEDAVKAWRYHKENDQAEPKSSSMPMISWCPKWSKTIHNHCQCISPGVGDLLRDFLGKLLCFTLGLGCCCTSHLGIEENGYHAENNQEITHKWSTEQAHDLKNVTINLGDYTSNGI